MLRITCDTNTLISGFLFKGKEKKLLELIAENKVQLYLSNEVISEFSRVLKYPRLVSKYASHSEIMDTLLELSHIVESAQKIDLIKEDPTDNKVLECAMAAKAKYIISGDNHLLKIKRNTQKNESLIDFSSTQRKNIFSSNS